MANDILQRFVPDVRKRLEALDDERERLAAFLKLVDSEEAKPPSVRQTASKTRTRKQTQRRNGRVINRPAGVRDAVLLRYLDAVLEEPDTFTALGMHEKFQPEWTTATTRNVFAFLHAQEILGKAGKEEGFHGRVLFRVLPEGHARAEQLRQTINDRLQEATQ